MNDIVRISKALSDPIRYRILLMLINQERSETLGCCNSPYEGVCNCDIVAALGLIQSRVSYHMKELVDSELVLEETKGKWKYYFLNREILRKYIERIRSEFRL